MFGKKYIIWGVLCLWTACLFGCGGPAKAKFETKNKKNYNEAIPLYKEYLAENPDSAEARLNMGIAYLKTGFADAAIAEFETVLKSSPNHPDAVLYMGLAHLSKGKLDEAIVVLENYRNSRKPLVEEEVMHQMTLLEDLYASDKTLFEENPMIIVNRVETAVNNALAEQKRADRQALKMSKEQNNNKGCFAYDTNVLMADKSLKRIIDLRAGDTVQAYDVETEKMVVRKVTDTYRADQDHYYLINGELKITAAHPVFTTEGEWVKVADLKVGDRIVSIDSEIKVASVKKIKYDHRVYNFRVENSHNYFVSADGKNFYLVHN